MKYSRSFTLLETIVAVYVLLAGIVGAMNLTQQNIKAVALFRHQLIAANLAQEGAELVRNRRDSNSLRCYYDAACFDIYNAPPDNPNKQNMLGIIDASVGCNTTFGCRVSDPLVGLITFDKCDSDGAVGDFPSNACKFLWFNPSDGLYSYNTGFGGQTIFDRRIRVQQMVDRDLTSPDEDLHDWKVISTVKWCEKLDCTKRVEVQEILTPNFHRL